MSLIHGSRGLIFFVHQFKPTFREAALLDDPEMLAAVTELNRQITELAPVLNSPPITNRVSVRSADTNVPIAVLTREFNGAVYVFAAGMREGATGGLFTVKGIESNYRVEVIGEGRTLIADGGVFNDRFVPWDVHLYRCRKAE